MLVRGRATARRRPASAGRCGGASDTGPGLVQAARIHRQGRPDPHVRVGSSGAPPTRSPGWSVTDIVAVGDGRRRGPVRRPGARVAAPGRGGLRPGRGPGRTGGAPPARAGPVSAVDAAAAAVGRGRRAGRLPLRRLPHREEPGRLGSPWPSSHRAAPTPRRGRRRGGRGRPAGRVGQPGPRPGQRAAQLADPGAVRRHLRAPLRRRRRALRRGLGRGADRRGAPRRPARGGPGLEPAAPAGPGRVPARRPHRDRRPGPPSGPGGQGHHLRLRRPLPQDGGRHGDHEDRHGRGRRRARRCGCRRRPRGPDPDHRLRRR